MTLTKDKIKEDFINKTTSLFAQDVSECSNSYKYLALASLVKDYAAQNWLKTNKQYAETSEKQVYYFSMEFLIGRLLQSNLINLGIRDLCEEALKELNINLRELEETEVDAGLGNGGLGRLAACFLDSMASLGLPGHGNGIRYNYGLFEQKIVNGYQVEIPDNWLKDGNIWETRKDDKSVIVKFYGTVKTIEKKGRLNFELQDYEAVRAVPYDTPIIGYNNKTVNTLRLWSSEPVHSDFDLYEFSKGDYCKAQEYKADVQAISQVLYPDDSTEKGKLLRLKQQYFFVCAGIHSIIKRFKKSGHSIFDLDKHVQIHINDTHPSIAVAELMRILIDEEELNWDDAFRITVNTLAYTNHTILSEALEKWPIDLFKKLLPRIYMIIEEINRRFCEDIRRKFPNDEEKVRRMSIINDGVIKMAYLAIVGSHSVNGVAKLHTDILKHRELKDFYDMYTLRFNNKTNGITHRRWLLQANPELASLITNTIGEDWIKNPKELSKLRKFATDTELQNKIDKIKFNNKLLLARHVKDKYDILIDPNSIFDIQVKRLHAYKRQVLNILHIMYLYNTIKENPNLDLVPRTFFFGAKASPSYHLAKETIKLINTVATLVNNDPVVNKKIKVIFLENYRVSLAEKVIPCADVSEQISTTTFEASGTGNMKFMMNGAITLATLDGANVEIYDAVGADNIVLFGMDVHEVTQYLNFGGYSSRRIYNEDNRLRKVLDQLIDGSLNVSPYEFKNLRNSLLDMNDEYFVLKDFNSYVKAQEKIDLLYRDHKKWLEMCIINIAESGIFSSDNTIKEYAIDIWNTNPVKIK